MTKYALLTLLLVAPLMFWGQAVLAQAGQPRAFVMVGYNGVDLGTVALGSTREFSIKVKNTGNGDLVWSIPSEPMMGFTAPANFPTIPPGKIDSARMQYVATELGHFHSAFSLKTNEPEGNRIIKVEGTVMEPDVAIERITGPSIHFSDTIMDVGEFVTTIKGSNEGVYFTCQNLGHKPLNASFSFDTKYISQLQVYPSTDRAKIKDMQPGQSAGLSFSVKWESLLGAFDIPIAVNSDDAEQPVRTLHIKGHGYLLESFPDRGPRIRFDTTTIDIGELVQGSEVKFEYWFTNVGDAPLLITQVKSSCGCYVPYWPREPVPPGGRAVITGKYDSNRIGGIHKTLTVQCNDPTKGTIVLIAKGNIHPKTPDEPTFLLPKEFWPTQLVHQTGTLELNELSDQVIKIPFKNGGLTDLLIRDVVGNSGLRVLTWTTTAIGYGSSGEIEVAIPKRIGTFSYSIAVTTNHPTDKVVYVRIEGILADGE